MSPAEAVHRGRDAGRRPRWARRQVLPGAEPALCGTSSDRIFAVAVPDAATLDVPADAAAAVIGAPSGSWPGNGPSWAYGGRTVRPGLVLRPADRAAAPDRRLAFRIHHRDETETGNIKQVWEMSGTTTSPCWRPPGG